MPQADAQVISFIKTSYRTGKTLIAVSHVPWSSLKA
jgi:putative intracellular protease/amidase